MPRPLRRAVLLALLLLAGCNSARVGRDYALEGKAADTEAVLMAQIRPASPIARDVRAIGLMLQRFEPTSGELVGNPIYLMATGLARPGYSVMRVAPGAYLIRALVTRHVPLFGIKEINRTFIDGSMQGQPRGAHASIRGMAADGLRLLLPAGEVSYVGDYHVEVQRRTSELVTIERRDDVARQTLAYARPKLRDAPFAYRGPVYASGAPVEPGSRPRVVGVDDDGSIRVEDLEQPGLDSVESPR